MSQPEDDLTLDVPEESTDPDQPAAPVTKQTSTAALGRDRIDRGDVLEAAGPASR